MFKVTFFVISLLTGSPEVAIEGAVSYADMESCIAAGIYLTQEEIAPVGYDHTWECKEA